MKVKTQSNSTIYTIFLIAIFFGLSCKLANSQGVQRVALMLDYETGYGGYVYPVYNPYVFFRDGTVIKNPKVAIESLDKKARDKSQGRWGKWRNAGNKVQIIWDGVGRNGKPQTSEKDWKSPEAYSAGRGETLNGSWSSMSGGGNIAFGGNFGSFSLKNFTFRSDGRFTTEKTGGASDTNMTVYSKNDSAGKYSLNGYTLTLHFNNGKTTQLFFCYLGKDRDVFNIAGNNYTSAKSKKNNK